MEENQIHPLTILLAFLGERQPVTSIFLSGNPRFLFLGGEGGEGGMNGFPFGYTLYPRSTTLLYYWPYITIDKVVYQCHFHPCEECVQNVG